VDPDSLIWEAIMFEKDDGRRSFLMTMLSSAAGMLAAGGMLLMGSPADAAKRSHGGPSFNKPPVVKPPVITPKYGITPGPVVKYGIRPGPIVTPKYGIMPRPTVKYGIRPFGRR
jgi:hypothetical protein